MRPIPFMAAAALAAASPALAQISPGSGGPSGRWGSVDVSVGTYTPDTDSEFAGKPAPPSLPAGAYDGMFGGKRGWMFTGTLSKTIFSGFGSVDVGFRTGYFEKSAKGLVPITGTDAQGNTVVIRYDRAGADSGLHIIPTSAVLTYRFDWPVERYRIPLAPYARVAFERYNWWITRGSGGTVERGATMGWSATGGLAFLMDILDPTLAREFDRDSGVNHSYLFFEVTTGKIDDFGSSKSWDLSPRSVMLTGGMTFVF